MAVSQGVRATIAYTAYASGAMTANLEDNAPVVTGSQFLRRVSSTLDLKIASYKATEIRPDMQIASFRHGGRSVAGDIAGDLSPGTYFDFIEAVHMDTRAAGASSSQVALTTMQCSHSASTITFTGGNPVTAGFIVGEIVTLTGAISSANDNVNFLITAFGGTSNRTVTVFPAPTLEASASSTFTIAAAGYTTLIPTSGQVSRKYGIEIYDVDTTISRLFTETRATKYAVELPTSGIVKTTVSFMGRDMVANTSEYFTTPTAVTTTDTTTSTSGVVMINGVAMGIITSLTFDVTRAAAQAPVVGQVFDADVILGTASVSGTMSVYLTDLTLMNMFLNETEASIAVMVQSTTAANSPAISFYLPAVKYSGATINLSGEAGQIMSMPFQALLYNEGGSDTVGIPVTTVFVHDTQAGATQA